MKDEALRMALEALEFAKEGEPGWTFLLPEVITTIKEALAAPVPMAHIVGEIDHAGKVWAPAQPAPVQPVAWRWVNPKGWLTYGEAPHDTFKSTALYTTPPAQRQWVGLTNNELQPIANEYRILFGSWVEDFAAAIETKLKEKNT
jgi:hypothetical protein